MLALAALLHGTIVLSVRNATRKAVGRRWQSDERRTLGLKSQISASDRDDGISKEVWQTSLHRVG